MKKNFFALMLSSLLLSTIFVPEYIPEDNYGIAPAFILDDMADGY